jgi:Ca2+-binding EF-hand superfamily protein
MSKTLQLPFERVDLESTGEVTAQELNSALADSGIDLTSGASILVLASGESASRGGYFFHIEQTGDSFTFHTFDRRSVITFESMDDVLRFINHVAGRKYDSQMWERSQEVNLRTDDLQ